HVRLRVAARRRHECDHDRCTSRHGSHLSTRLVLDCFLAAYVSNESRILFAVRGPRSVNALLRCGAADRPQQLAAAMKARTRSRSLMPGARSTPLATSTQYGVTARIASATLSGRSPP